MTSLRTPHTRPGRSIQPICAGHRAHQGRSAGCIALRANVAAGASQSQQSGAAAAEPAPEAAHALAHGRRQLLVAGPLTALGVASWAPAALALSGPAEFWRSRQRQNGGAKLIAPIKVAQQKLAQAKQELGSLPEGSLLPVLQAVRASSLNCYYFEALDQDSIESKTSLWTQKYNLVDPCTFRIVVKSVTSLSPEADKEQGLKVVDAAAHAYEELDRCLLAASKASGQERASALGEARTALDATIVAVDAVEAFMKRVLEVPSV